MTKRIVQDWLNLTSAGFLENDFATYRSYMQFPVSITTDGGGNWLIGDDVTLQKGFDAWIDMMQSQRVTDLVRSVRNCEILDDGDLWARYTTELLRNAVRVVPAYDSLLRLRNVDGVWKCTMVMSGLSNPTWPVIVPRVRTAQINPPGAIWPRTSPPPMRQHKAAIGRTGDIETDRT